MKKQTNLPAGGRKLSLNKKTILNLQPLEMEKKVGGGKSYFHICNGPSINGNTCYGHRTC
jgi:hypothetical protein